MASNNNMSSTRTSHNHFFCQSHVGYTQDYSKARRQQHLDWANGQRIRSEAQLSSSIPQKRSGSTASLIGTEPGPKRPSIVGLPISFR